MAICSWQTFQRAISTASNKAFQAQSKPPVLRVVMIYYVYYKVLIFLLPEYLINYLSLIIIGVYMYIIPYNISFMRAYLVMLLMTLFKKYLNQLDCFSLVAMFFVFMNPYIIYNLSFVFSYFMYLIIILRRGLWKL